MKIKALLAVILGISCVLSAAAQSDISAHVAAQVREGKVSGPALLARYLEMTKREPQNPQHYVMAAAVADRDDSPKLYEKALAIAPDYLPARIGLARYYMRRYEPAQAYAQFQKLESQLGSDSALRLEAVRAAVRSSHMEQALRYAGDDFDCRVEIVQALLDDKKFDAARKALIDLKLDADARGPVLAAKGRLEYLQGQEPKADPELRKRGINLLLEAWRKSPELLVHYRNFNPYPRESLVQILSKSGRKEDARKVVADGLKALPQEYPLYELVWKDYFAEPKADYTAERERVRKEAEALLNAGPISPALLKTVAAGYEMASAPEAKEGINQRILAEFPYSDPAQSLRRIEALRCKDERQKVALLAKYNEDFLTFPLYNEYFAAVDKLDPRPVELLHAAEIYMEKGPYSYLAAYDIGQVFVRRGIYMDRLEKWLDQSYKGAAEDKETKALGAWEGRLLSIRGKMQLLQGKPALAEKTLRRILDMKAQGYSNVDNARTRMYLGDVLLAQGRKEEAMETYAQAYAESQHYFTDPGDQFRKLYRQLKGSDKGMDEYLTAREDMFQVAASTGIERGTKINEPAPDFNLLNPQGGRVSLASLKGKVVVLNFWATWCGPCIAELPHFQEFYDQVKNDPGVALYAITTDENRGLVGPFLKKNNYSFPVLFDEGVRAKFGVRGIPATFILDPNGMTRLRMVGFNQNEPLVPYLTRLVTEYRSSTGKESAAAPAPVSEFKLAFDSVERTPHSGLTDAAWKEAQSSAAKTALAKLGQPAAGSDLYYAAMLESKASLWKPAVEHFQQYLALPPGTAYEDKTTRMNATMRLRDAFISGGMLAEGEKYYSNDPIGLGVFFSTANLPARALEVYEKYLASNPPAEAAQRTKSLIIYALEDMGNADAVARRLEQYKADITANSLVNSYVAISNMYRVAGNRAMAEKYTNLVFEMGKSSKEGKAVDGPVAAHIEQTLKRLEQGGDAEQTNAFVQRVRTELAGNKMVMQHLDARERQRNIVNQPATELQIDYVLNGKPTSLKELKGRIVLLDFFAHWCGPCIAGFPGVRELQQKYKDQGLVVLGLTGIYGYYKGTRGLSIEDELKRMETDFVKEYQVTWPMIFAKSKANDQNYGISYIPHLILIDREGIVRLSIQGKGYDEALDTEIQKLISETKRAASN